MKFLPSIEVNQIHRFTSRSRIYSLFIFLFFLINSGKAQTGFIPCANNNDDPPSYTPANANDPNFGATLEISSADVGPGSDFCIGNDPGKDTQGGCGSFLFSGFDNANDDCPIQICFSPRQGCGNALGNICVWVEDPNSPGNWISLGAPETTEVCVFVSPGLPEYAVTLCRPGNGPVSVNDVSITFPPSLDIGIDKTICNLDVPTTIDLTVNEPVGQTGGNWSDDGGTTTIADPTNYPINGVAGDMFTFTYTFDATSTQGYNCQISDEIKYTITNDCCIFEITCPTNTDLGDYDCDTPVPDPVVTNTGGDISIGTPYNIEIGDTPCGTVEVSFSDDQPFDVCATSVYTITRTVTVFDDLNNNQILDSGEDSQICTFTYDVIPIPLPVISCPTQAPITCEEVANFSPADAMYTNGLAAPCLLEGTVSGVADAYTGDGCGGTLTVRYNGTDDCGRTLAEQACEITVTPSALPVISCPTQAPISCEAVATFSPADAMYTNGLAAPCLLEGTVSGVADAYTGDGCGGTLTVRYNGTDDCGRTLAEQACEITVTPSALPVISCPTQTPISCEAVATFSPADAMYTNGLAAPCLLEGTVSGVADAYTGDGCEGTLTVRYNGTDDCGRDLAEQACEITVTPSALPVISCPTQAPISCEAVATFSPMDAMYTNGLAAPCLLEGTVMGVADAYTGDGCGGTLTVRYNGTGDCGRTLAEQACEITVTPSALPVISCPTQAPISCEAVATFSPADAMYTNGLAAPCLLEGTVSGVADAYSGDGCGGTLTVRYNGTDDCGRTLAEQACEITVTPSALPVISCPTQAPISCEAVATFSPMDAMYTNGLAAPCLLEGTVMGVADAYTGDGCGGTLTVRYNGTGDCGRTLAEQACEITVTPSALPVISCPTQAPISCEAVATFSPADAMYTNGLAAPCLLEGTVMGVADAYTGDGCGGTLTVRYNGTDDCGRTLAEQACEITVTPSALPVISCPTQAPISCEAVATFSPADAMYTNGLAAPCLLEGTVSGVADAYTGDGCGGTLTVRYNGTDDCGRTLAEQACEITVTPSALPVISCPTQTPISCEAVATFSPADAMYTNGLAAPCLLEGTVSGVADAYTGDGCEGTLTVRYNGTDDCGRDLAEQACEITVTPSALPVISCPTQAPISCEAVATFSPMDAMYTNGLAAPCLLEGTVMGVADAYTGDGCGGTLTVRYNGTGDCGRTLAEQACEITVTPSALPVISCPTQAPISCEAVATFSPADAMYTNGLAAPCLLEGTVMGVADAYTGDGCGGTLTVRYNGTDDCGRTLAEQACEITVTPSALPVISCPTQAPISCEAVATFSPMDAMYTNGLAAPCLLEGTVMGVADAYTGDGCGGTLTVRYNGTGDCGRTLAEQACEITVTPSALPVISCPTQAPISCEAVATFSPADAMYTNGLAAPCLLEGTVMGVADAYTGDGCGGTLTVRYNGTDDCGRTLAEQACEITVTPSALPVISCPTQAPISCEAVATFSPMDAMYTNGLAAPCLLEGTVMGVADAYTGDGCGGTLTVRYNGTDDCGRTLAEQACEITVTPSALPVISCPTQAPISCEAVATFSPADAMYTNGLAAPCLLEGTVMGVADAYTGDGCGGTLTVRYNGTDDCGRDLAEQTCEVTVTPSALPVISCPTQAPISCEAVATFSPADAMYSNGLAAPCLLEGTVSGVADPYSGDGCGGALTVRYNGTDDCGRDLAEQTCEVTVTPSALPVISCPTQAPISCEEVANFSPMDAMYSNGLAAPCLLEGTVSGVADPYAGDGCGGTLTLRYNGMDDCGRDLAEQACEITVTPSDLPVISCPAQAPISCEAVATFSPADAMYTNGLAAPCLLEGTVSGVADAYTGDGCGGTLTVRYNGTDNCGRDLAEQACEITVTPSALPVISCPAQAPISCEAVATFSPADAMYSNGLAAPCLLEGTVSGVADAYTGDGCGGTLTVRYNGTDDCGRDLAEQACEITVTPSALPVISCPTQAPISCEAVATFSPMDAMYSNGLAAPCLLEGTVSGLADAYTGDGCGGTLTVRYNGTDDCGRTLAEQTCEVTVTPSALPVISCPTQAPISCEEVANFSPADAMYSNGLAAPCLLEGTVSGVADPYSGDGCGGALTVRYNGTDDCGRDLAEQTCDVTVTPSALPVISCPTQGPITCEEVANFDPADAMYTNGLAAPCLLEGTVMGVADAYTGDGCGGTLTVRYNGMDDCGRDLAEQTCEITVTPSALPVISCPTQAPISCEAVATFSPADAMYSNGLAAPCLLEGTVMGVADAYTGDGCGGTLTVRYNGTDDCGRDLAEQTCEVTVTPSALPVISCPTQAPISCEAVANFSPADAMYSNGLAAPCLLEGTVSGVADPYSGDGCGGTLTVRYNGTDDCGRDLAEQTCEVTVTPSALPVISCPTIEAISCDDVSGFVVPNAMYTNSSSSTCNLSGMVSGSVISNDFNSCGGTLTILYQGVDDCGRTLEPKECTVEVLGGPPPTIAVVPYVSCTCLEGINPNPAFAEVTTSCGSDYDVTVSGPVIDGTPNCPGTTATYTYTVTDDCGRTASATQVYTIENEGPILDCPNDCVVLGCFDGQYELVVEAWLLTASATSDCSAQLEVQNNYSGVNELCIFDGNTAVQFWATDDCGRTTSCTREIILVDTDAPQIIGTPQELLVPCHANTQQIFNDWLDTQGGVEAYDDCWTDEGDITWTASVGPEALDCSNGPQAIVVDFTATDGCGNSSSVTGIFNTKILPNMINVSGLIETEEAEPVADVQVGMYSASSGIPNMDISTSSGNYAFPEVEYDESITIEPEKNNDVLNGLTTFDLILLQQHILDIVELNSPYKKIAADINRSGTISTLDLVLLRRVILFIDEEFADNTSWRFVDADFVFPNPDNPFETEFPEAYSITGVEEEVADFIAVKIGDLNLSAETSNFSGQVDDRSGLDELIFEVEDQKLIAGEEYLVEVKAKNFEAIRGFQMTLDYDHSLISVLDIKHGALNDFDEANYNLAFAHEGQVPMSWNDQVAQNLSFGDAAFRIIIKANADVQLSEVLSVNSGLTRAEAYNTTDLMNVSLVFSNNDTNVTAEKFRLFQNQPNPFMDATTIGFQLPEAGEVTLEIYDVTGKLVYTQRGDFAAGYNQIDLDRSDLQAGILYYQVSTATDSKSEKMIVLK